MNTLRKAAFVLDPKAVLEPLRVDKEWTRRLVALERKGRPISLTDLDRRPLTRPVRTTIAVMGTTGLLARLLNGPEGSKLHEVWKRLSWSGLGIYLSGGTASDHPKLGEHGLPNEELDLPEAEVHRALWELVFFEKAGCVVTHCDHSDHWFVSEDRRRVDCILHRQAGARRRYRTSPAQQRRRKLTATNRTPRA